MKRRPFSEDGDGGREDEMEEENTKVDVERGWSWGRENKGGERGRRWGRDDGDGRREDEDG